ncbi:permease, partial [Enterococcus hirae]
MVGAMGLAALFLAGVGLYGLVQYTVARDIHELGVRLALGGGRVEILRVVRGKGARLVAWGTGLGLMAALALAPGLSGFLAGVSPQDP